MKLSPVQGNNKKVFFEATSKWFSLQSSGESPTPVARIGDRTALKWPIEVAIALFMLKPVIPWNR